MNKFERQSVIFDLLLRNKSVNVRELSDILKASMETVRRDLTDMEERGLIKRIHGGAILPDAAKNELEHPYNIREIHQYHEKDRICSHAATFIKDGDLVFIDNSSTTHNIIRYINPSYHVTIVTNSIRQLMESANVNNSNLTMICLGGMFRPRNFSIVGGMSIELANRFNPTRTFISCRSIDLVKGLYDGSLYELETKRSFIESSSEVFLLADHTKFDASGSVHLCDLSKISHIITDSKVSDAVVQKLSNRNISLSVVQTSN